MYIGNSIALSKVLTNNFELQKKKSNATDHLFEALGAAHSSISSVEDDVDIVEAGIEFNTGNVDSNKSLEDNCDKLSPGKMEEDVEPKSPDEPDDESVDSDGSSVDSQEAPQAVKNLENNGLTKNTLEVESVEHLVFNKQTLISERNGVDDITVVAPENVGSNIDGENWETVEVRGRGSRKKPAERFNNVSVRHFNNISSVALPYDATKKPKVSRTVIPRKKVVAKRIVRDILNAIIDSIEEESRKKKQHFSTPPRTANSWKNGPPGSRLLGQPAKRDFASVVSTSAAPISDISLRTVVTGNRTPAQDKKHLSQEEISKKSGGQIVAGVDAIRTSPESKQSKAHPRTSADQSTAPTFQETISTSSNVKTGSKQELLNAAEDRKSESSSAEDTEEVPTINVQRTATKTEETLTNTPPLPTLLSPENANSATSSVASSLEAPHAGRLHHHSATSANVNDVGYHLLDVCDRLSRDMSLFMSRRALALSARRRERCAIMSALQDSVSLLWPRRCHVELYGSCATQLDLPSSDIDVVVLGLDRLDSSCPVVNSSKSASSDSMGTSLSMDEFSLTDDTQQVVLPHFQTATFGMLPVHRNADRVLRLAAELEGQPWAVQVNAIPTASVPVVKVLADPSKLTCNGGEWMAQHQHMVAQVAAAAGKCQPLGNKSSQEFTASEHGSFHPTLLPWRGSDVMKGLLSLDITFEGPEHGGVGSTEFSSRIVMDACAESGLHPDATPFVQVLMVLKELLSQRKLNEPYSGGLSSYALLLLVLALVHERAVIRDEIERVEQQKRAMTSGDQSTFVPAPNAFLTASVNAAPFFHPSYPVGGNPMTMATVVTVDTPATANSKPVTAYSKQESKSSNGFKKDIGVSTKLSQKKALQTSGPKNRPQSVKDKNTEPVRSSQDIGKPLSLTWASIAKNSSVQLIHKNPPREKPTIQADHDENTKTERKPSFADAVMRSTKRIEASVLKSASSVEKVVSQDGDLENEYSPADKCITEETGRLVQKSACQVSTKKFPSIANIEPLPIAPVVSPLGDSTPRVTPPFHPQGYNDIIEVLCSGETTAGKLLMHFLLFYGQHFDAQSTAVDVSGKHERDFTGHMAPFSYQSPYIQRRAHGNIDPITGMLTVDPIVIYDPLEGAENNNVARRCFAWNSVRWIFAQSYATLASAVERSATPPSTPGSCSVPVSSSRESRGRDARVGTFNPEAVGDLLDPSSPILKCLLSF